MIELLSTREEVKAFELPFKRYIGAQFGVHNPAGKRVGEVSHKVNAEYLFVVCTSELLTRIPDAQQRLSDFECNVIIPERS